MVSRGAVLTFYNIFIFLRDIIDVKFEEVNLKIIKVPVDLCRCVLRGCVPKKILVYGSAFGGEFQVSLF